MNEQSSRATTSFWTTEVDLSEQSASSAKEPPFLRILVVAAGLGIISGGSYFLVNPDKVEALLIPATIGGCIIVLSLLYGLHQWSKNRARQEFDSIPADKKELFLAKMDLVDRTRTPQKDPLERSPNDSKRVLASLRALIQAGQLHAVQEEHVKQEELGQFMPEWEQLQTFYPAESMALDLYQGKFEFLMDVQPGKAHQAQQAFHYLMIHNPTIIYDSINKVAAQATSDTLMPTLQQLAPIATILHVAVKKDIGEAAQLLLGLAQYSAESGKINPNAIRLITMLSRQLDSEDYEALQKTMKKQNKFLGPEIFTQVELELQKEWEYSQVTVEAPLLPEENEKDNSFFSFT